MRTTVVVLLLCALTAGVVAADWPTWRYDEQRRATSPDALPAELHLQWARELPEPMRAWPFQYDDAGKLDFDVSYEPVAVGNTLVIGSMVSDSVTAYDTRTGEELWRFYANGPVRFAPAIWEGRVYAGSDDGYLYCLDLDSGEVLWSFRAGPPERYLLGNERMVDVWSVRGGPVIRDGTVYFSSGVFPLMGTFLCALDAETGAVEWINSGTGSMYNLHQHGGAFSFGGVAPQGYVVATEDRVMFPGGRTPPAVHDRATGDFIFWRHSSGHVGKGAGGYGVWVQDGFYHNPNTAGEHMYALEDGAQWGTVSIDLLSDEHRIGLSGDELVGYAAELNVTEVEVTDRLGRGEIKERYELVELFRAELDIDVSKLHIRAGDRVYASNPDGLIAAIDLPGDDGNAQVSWRGEIDGTPWSMIAADDRLFVTTEEGAIFCFGPDAPEFVRHTVNGTIERPQDAWASQAAAMLDAGEREGFALVLGAASGRLVHELVGQSDLHVLVVEPNAERVEQMRRLYDDAGYYGRRVAILHADPTQVDLAPYFASLITAENLQALNIDPEGYQWERTARRVFEMLRPYGGMAWLPLSGEEHTALSEWVNFARVPGAQIARAQTYTTLTREGPLPGAGQWTHQYADSANTGVSWDSIAQAPLGLLWYGGGYNNHNALPRHQNGPVPQVVGGRLFIMGVNSISGRDVYTGRKLWIAELPGVGEAFTSLEHEAQLEGGSHPYFPNQPGANYVGSPYASVDDGVYVVNEGRCLRFDPATGELLSEFSVQTPDGEAADMGWGFVLHDDLLITGVAPQFFDDAPIGGEESWNATSSDHLAVLNRHTGEVLWQMSAEIGFRHNTIIADDGKVFVIDGLSEQQLELLERRGETPEAQPNVMALDAQTGELLWTSDGETFGTWLSYSAEHDILIQSGRYGARRPLPDEPRERMLAHSGTTGEVVWERSARYSGPMALRGDQIITGRGEPGINLLTGETQMRLHPLTGVEIPWSFTRTYGCGTQNVSENLITFRSGAAGYYDLARDGGTGNMSGFRSGCTNNVVVADGVVNAPEYTRSCFCSYPIQTSVGLIHMPDIEMWTYTDAERGSGAVRNAGINLGAPGSRLDEVGTWWLEYPFAGGSALELPVEMSTIDGERWGSRAAAWEPRTFTHHSSWVADSGSGMSWIAASGVEGSAQLTVDLRPQGDDEVEEGLTYTVRLHFIEPGVAEPGQRRFKVLVQDREIITGLDVVREAGGARRALVQEVTGVALGNELRLGLVPEDDAEYPPVLCGIELVLEDDAQAAAQNRADARYQWASVAPTWTERIADALSVLPFVAWLS